MRLNYEKLQYKQEEVYFFRETYTTNGCKPAHSKVKGTDKKQAPTCKKQVQYFIGMINYLSRFSARLSELAEPIRELCKEKVPFNWGPEYQEVTKLVKREIITTPVLAYYNPRKQTVLQTDTSIEGLGACLLQDQTPVYFASKALTKHRGICCYRIGILGHGDGKVSSLSIHKPLHSRDRPKSIGHNTV